MTDQKEISNRLGDLERRVKGWMMTSKYCSWCREWGHSYDECEKRQY
jgi:hypothetical protein